MRPSFHAEWLACPIESTLSVLGRKWALVLMRDISFFGRSRFKEFLEANDALTPRVLSRRLRELHAAGLLQRVQTTTRAVEYHATEKGKDAMPILAALFAFGAKHFPEHAFADGQARGLDAVFPGQQAEILRDLQSYSLRQR